MVRLLRLGVETNRIITRGTDVLEPKTLKRGERLWVYKEPHCHVCGTGIDTLKSASRTLYFCPRCQG